MRYSGHALRHISFHNLCMKGLVSILKSSVTMEQGMSIWIGFQGLVKGLEYEVIVIAITNHIGNWPTVTKVKDSTEVYLFNSTIFGTVLEFSHIRDPFLVVLVCMEIAFKHILCCIVRISGWPCTAIVPALYYRLQFHLATDTQYTLIVYMQAMVMLYLVTNSAVAHIRMLLMYIFG